MSLRNRYPVLATFLVGACSDGATKMMVPDASTTTPPDMTALAYPSLTQIYAGDQGVYRGCGPNGGVCHNAREYPSLATMGSLVELVGKPCNQRRDEPATIHDLCERTGDLLEVGGARAEIGSVVAVDAERLRWRASLATPLTIPARGARGKIVRPFEGTFVEIYDFVGSVGVEGDPADQKTAFFIIETPSNAEAKRLQSWFENAGVPGDPAALQVGDPNRNGTFGATQGGALVRPGKPDKSYLLVRLLDPEAGPVMPRANCCHWTKSSLRALWCWVAGLDADGGNAMAPIKYEGCPSLPAAADDILYPTPGPSCETSGMCPVRPKESWPEGAPATFANVYKYILQPSCGGSGSCHDGAQPGAGLSMKTEGEAFRDLLSPERPRVVAGQPQQSLLVQRIDPNLCKTPQCVPMPLGRAPLDEKLRGHLATWISEGAKP